MSHLRDMINEIRNTGKDVAILCIGTEKHTWDSLGPMCGTLLKLENENLIVHGCIGDNLSATNVKEASARYKEEYKDKVIGRTPMRSFGTPEDVGWAAVYLASNAAKFVTGTTLAIDGGAIIGL